MAQEFRTTTTTALLDHLADTANDAVWSQFDARYRPIITGFAVNFGLGEADAAEVAQQTLVEFARAFRAGKYDRRHGRLRFWIMGIARHRCLDVFRRQKRQAVQVDEGVLASLEATGPDGGLDAVWDAEQNKAIANEALRRLNETRLNEKTIRAFMLTTMHGMTVEGAAAECGMSAGDVYAARNRVAERLRDLVDEIRLAWSEDV